MGNSSTSSENPFMAMFLQKSWQFAGSGSKAIVLTPVFRAMQQ